MPARPLSFRILVCTVAAGLALLPLGRVSAQQLAAEPLAADIRHALIWTGHLTAFAERDTPAAIRAAAQDWQKSKRYSVTQTLSNEQSDELVAEGTKHRESVGWSVLRDKSVGFSIGVPTRLVKFRTTRQETGAIWYDFDGGISYGIGVWNGQPDCSTMDAFFTKAEPSSRTIYRTRQDDWFALAEESSGRVNYLRAVCRASGVLAAGINIPLEQFPRHGPLLAAMVDSLKLVRAFNAKAAPQPRIDPLPTRASAVRPEPGQQRAAIKPAASVDGTGKTNTLSRQTRSGTELRAEQVFEKAAGAVYMVKAGRRMGSAVAISGKELLTNCHVVGDLARVTLVHDGQELPAEVASADIVADRCVLRVSAPLPSWVSIRPYDDIKVGERALTIGTPQGLEFTVAEGIVSSKRTQNQARMIQTSAPISQGSSGGGLFDLEGHLLGITTFYYKGGQNLNFAVAAEEYAR